MQTKSFGWALLVSMALAVGTDPDSFAQEIVSEWSIQRRPRAGRVDALSKHLCWCDLRRQL